jgi:hypothetical protein
MNGFCDNKGCKDRSTVRPILLFFAPWPSDCPARGMLGREYCSEHGTALRVDEFITDESWPKICDGFDCQGKVRPERARVTLELEPVLHVEEN